MQSERVMYRQRFFATRQEAADFRRRRGGGVILNDHKKSQHVSFRIEAAIAGMTLAQIAEKPWCVAWNEAEGNG